MNEMKKEECPRVFFFAFERSASEDKSIPGPDSVAQEFRQINGAEI